MNRILRSTMVVSAFFAASHASAQRPAAPRLFEGAPTVASISISPDGRRIAAGSDDGTARIWDVATGRRLHLLRTEERGTQAIAFSPDGRTVATGGNDGALRLWSAATGLEVRTVVDSSRVTSVAWSPNGRLVATGGADGKVRVYTAATGVRARVLTGHAQVVSAVAFSPDGKTLASSSFDGNVLLRDPADGRIRATLQHPDRVTGMAFSPDGRMLLTATLVTRPHPSPMRLWNVAAGTLARALPADVCDELCQFAWVPRGQRALVSSSAGVRLHSLASGAPPVTVVTRAAASIDGRTEVDELVVFPDGRRMAGASGRWVRVWDVPRGRAVN